jgi:membrane protein DedA with SNARE-associated domain
LAAGALAAGGGVNMVSAIASTILACVMADSFWFYVGQRGSQGVFRLFARLGLAQYLHVQSAAARSPLRGLRRLIAAKFLPLGTLLPPLAGALGVRPLRFFLLDGLSSAFYATFYILIGFVFRNQLRQLSAVLQKLGFAAFLLIATLVAAYVAWTLVRRRRAQQGWAEKQNGGTPQSFRQA